MGTKIICGCSEGGQVESQCDRGGCQAQGQGEMEAGEPLWRPLMGNTERKRFCLLHFSVVFFSDSVKII